MRPSPSVAAGENRGSAFGAGAAAISCERKIVAGVQTDRHVGPVIGQPACLSSQHALAALVAGQIDAAAADPVAAIANSSTARIKRKRSMIYIRPLSTCGYSLIAWRVDPIALGPNFRCLI